MKPRRHRARGRAASGIVFPARGKKGKFGAIFLVLGCAGAGGAFRGYRPASGLAIKSVRPVRAAQPPRGHQRVGTLQSPINQLHMDPENEPAAPNSELVSC